jgi:hypothetical protein
MKNKESKTEKLKAREKELLEYIETNVIAEN